MNIALTQVETFAIAMIVLFIGSQLSSRIFILQKYNLPEPVVGGLIFSCITGLMYEKFDYSFSFDLSMMNFMMLTFFTTIGLGAKANLLRIGGKKLLVFLGVTVIFLFVQNIIGILLAKSLNLDPLIGLLAGSITLSGGHGTGATYAMKFPHIQGAMEIAMACATFGLVLGGLIGGPVAEKLISTYHLAPDDKIKDPIKALEGHGMDEPESVTVTTIFELLLMISICVVSAGYLQSYLQYKNLNIPTFILSLFFGIIITNVLELANKYNIFNYKIPQQTLDLVSVIALYVFLILALMSLKMWELFDLAGPLLIIVLVQTIVMGLFAFFITFKIMGKDYEAAVMASGHMGFGLGATPTAVANMEKIVLRYGAAPQAFLIVPIVGAFFIDIANTGIIQTFLYFFG